MTSIDTWLNRPTDVKILTCDGKGVVAKTAALRKLLVEVQQDALVEGYKNTLRFIEMTNMPTMQKINLMQTANMDLQSKLTAIK
jgi:hypothetical protein